MTAITDILDRLRDQACGAVECPHPYCELHDRAADEIDALRLALRWFYENVELDHDQTVQLYKDVYDEPGTRPDRFVIQQAIERAVNSGSTPTGGES